MKTKQMKQQEAIARNTVWAKLSDANKLELLKDRPGNCAKQIKKILNKKEQ